MIHIRKPVIILAVCMTVALMLVGCGPTAAQTSATASPAGPSATVSPSESPQASPAPTPGEIPTPAATPLRESNLYVLGAFMQRTAYVDAQTGYVMLPLQETAAALEASFSWDSVTGEVKLNAKGAEAVIKAGDNNGYVLIMDAEQVDGLEGTQLLQIRGGVIYAPDFLVEKVFGVAVTMNRTGDTLIALPQPEQSEQPQGSTAGASNDL